MSVLTPFIRRKERTPRPIAPAVGMNERVAVVAHPQLPPEAPIQSLTPNTRRAKTQVQFYLHPHAFQEDSFLFRGAVMSNQGATVPRGRMGAWGHRANVKRPIPETFGSRFEIGG